MKKGIVADEGEAKGKGKAYAMGVVIYSVPVDCQPRRR